MTTSQIPIEGIFMFRDHVALQGLVVAEEAATALRDRPDLVDRRDRQGLPAPRDRQGLRVSTARRDRQGLPVSTAPRDRQGLPVHLVRHRPVTPVTFCT